ncbi:MAG: hypothetical protein WCB46_05260 [Methanoregula sp.]|jgi:hypothetical protein
MIAVERLFGERIGRFIHESTGTIRNINQKYATPKIKLSGGAKLALLLLRLYLVFLVVLLAYKFWMIITGGA